MNAIFDLLGNILFSIYKALPVVPLALLALFAIKRSRGIPTWQTIGLVAFAMYMYSMLDLTLFSRLGTLLLHPDQAVTHTLSPVPFDGIVTMATTEYAGVSYNVFMRNVLGNVIMFMPFGFFLPLLWANLRSFGKVLAISALASFAIEFTQYWIGGIADIDDLMLNTVGACIGYGVYALSCMVIPAVRFRFSLRGRGAKSMG